MAMKAFRGSWLAAMAMITLVAGPASAQTASVGGSGYFLCRLIPARSTFPADITPTESAIMKRHVAYWEAESKRGRILIFGPVADPKAAWALLIIRAAAASEVTAETRRDP